MHRRANKGARLRTRRAGARAAFLADYQSSVPIAKSPSQQICHSFMYDYSAFSACFFFLLLFHSYFLLIFPKSYLFVTTQRTVISFVHLTELLAGGSLMAASFPCIYHCKKNNRSNIRLHLIKDKKKNTAMMNNTL